MALISNKITFTAKSRLAQRKRGNDIREAIKAGSFVRPCSMREPLYSSLPAEASGSYGGELFSVSSEMSNLGDRARGKRAHLVSGGGKEAKSKGIRQTTQGDGGGKQGTSDARRRG